MEFKVTGLNKKAKYIMMLDIVPADAYRLVYCYKIKLFKCKATAYLKLTIRAHKRSLRLCLVILIKTK